MIARVDVDKKICCIDLLGRTVSFKTLYSKRSRCSQEKFVDEAIDTIPEIENSEDEIVKRWGTSLFPTVTLNLKTNHCPALVEGHIIEDNDKPASVNFSLSFVCPIEPVS